MTTQPTLSKRHWAWFLVGMSLSAVLVLVTVTILNIRTQQKQTAPKIDATEETLRLVRDCVLEGGECYARNRKESEAMADVTIAASAYAAACAANGLKNADEIYECVRVEFEKRKEAK